MPPFLLVYAECAVSYSIPAVFSNIAVVTDFGLSIG